LIRGRTPDPQSKPSDVPRGNARDARTHEHVAGARFRGWPAAAAARHFSWWMAACWPRAPCLVGEASGGSDEEPVAHQAPPDSIVGDVLAVLAERSETQIAQSMRDQLPDALRPLWPA